ncbi:MAG: ATP-binding protein [Paracoccaceae bacterium]
MRLLPRSVRGRLWSVLTILSLAILGISGLTWTTLHRVDAQLEELHRQSLTQVAQAIDLSKRTSDLATSAPYLLTQRSNFLIEQEGEQLVAILRRVREQWPAAEAADTKRDELFPITLSMEDGINDLVEASQSLDQIQSQIRSRTATLSRLREDVTTAIEEPSTLDPERLVWWTLQSMNADALNAAYADNLIGVGEEQRQYQRQATSIRDTPLTKAQITFLDQLTTQVSGEAGIFELRRAELGVVLNAQNALFRIRRDANQINELAAQYAREAEAFLTQERDASSSMIQFTRVSIAAISLIALACALAAAMFVSRYVAFNIGRVSEAMVRLAKGDRSSALPRQMSATDEIGDLFRSFRSFRANALRLDRSHRQLNQRNALFEKVFANISDGIAITDAAGKLTASNPAFDNIIGLSGAKSDLGDIAHWFRTSRFGPSAIAAGLKNSHRGPLEFSSADGQFLELRASRLPDEGRVWLLADVTEQRKIQDRIDQMDRIETLGKLAGDTAHDFGNILATIRTHAHLLNTTSAPDNIAAIENAVEYGASLTERLLAFARKQPLTPEVVELNTLISGMIELVEIGLKSGVDVKVTHTADPVFVLADPGQLESAILNLVLNANNAMLTAGTIKIKVSNSDPNIAGITVIDTGVGMSPEVRKKAIEPFFTTRSAEGGTGLGLSIVYGFINQSGGTIDIKSREGDGTCIQIILPIAQVPLAADNQEMRTALILDDNPEDRRATATVLSSLGYTTVMCPSIEEATAALDQQTIDLIVSDFDLGPGQSGLDFLEAVHRRLPTAQRVLISGKSMSTEALPSQVAFLEKPVSQRAFALLT